MAESKKAPLFKIIIIGDTGVGKSCLMMRFADDKFTESFITTIGVDFRMKTLNTNGKEVKLQLWDTAGQERFRTITASYYRAADALLLVYDVCNAESFAHVESWLEDANRAFSPESKVVKLLVGTKADQADQRQVETKDGEALAQRLGTMFIETSAKTATNVDNAFVMMTQALVKTGGGHHHNQPGPNAPGDDHDRRPCCGGN